MAQTKYVLSKALNMKLRPLVGLNKMDRDAATSHRCDVVHSMIFDLFASLGADDEQLDFPTLYASGTLDNGGRAFASEPLDGSVWDDVPVDRVVTLPAAPVRQVA